MPTVLENVQSFLSATQGDLAARWSPAMETQVNVAADGGTREGGSFTDGTEKWWPIRIPKHANSQAEFFDYELRWDFAKHVEAIGCTGWDWVGRCSRWVGFDFDAITGHAAGVGITEESLEAVRAAACRVPWVEVRKSTGGAGLHLYVHLDALPSDNHTEHAARGRAVLSMLSSEAGFDFASQVDCCGGNMWIWHRKMAGTDGLALIKAAERSLTAADFPPNWRDHAEVVSRKRSKVRVRGVTNESEFETLATARKITPLDAQHKAIIDRLKVSGCSTIWVPDYHLLQTHTKGFEAIAGEYRGFFQTTSPGTDLGEPNCFAFPLPDGAFKVYRFSEGHREAETWEQDGVSWTTCYFNRLPDLKTAATALGGGELEDGKGYQFAHVSTAMEVAASLGEQVPLGAKFYDRPAILRANKDGRLVFTFKHESGDVCPGTGWIEKKNGWWAKVLVARTEGQAEECDNFDEFVRVLMTTSGQKIATLVASSSGAWDAHDAGYAKLYLQGLGHTKGEAEIMLGEAIRRRWEKVSLPFQPEYPGSRRWNLGAPQLRYRPADHRDDLQHPHWDKILAHLGQSLTPVLRSQAWAQKANVLSGADYLRAWLAVLLREPFERLPYLFFYGPENSGKSIFWEAFDLLVTGGVVKADRVLTNISEFNGELEGAILCVIEEKNISKTPGALNKIRDFVTGMTLALRKMRTDTYLVPNVSHWCQMSNELDACPVIPGDTRITVCYVPPLAAGAEIPKGELLERLTAEAPAFLRTLLDMSLPPAQGRLRIPIVETQHKDKIANHNRSPVESFIDECCFELPGARTTFTEFYARFIDWMAAEDRDSWSKTRVGKAIPAQFPYASSTGNARCVGNLSFTNESVEDTRPWHESGGKLVRID